MRTDTLKRLSGNQKGFSLIELMIVVAIIGILSAIAIPNYQRFQRKARQSEARSMLSGYYTAAKASMAEYGTNPGNFPVIGFQPEGQLTYRLTAADGPDPVPAVAANDNACIVTTAATCAAAFQVWTENANFAAAPITGVAANGGAGVATFTTVASANLGNGAADADTWTVDQAKAFVNANDGL